MTTDIRRLAYRETASVLRRHVEQLGQPSDLVSELERIAQAMAIAGAIEDELHVDQQAADVGPERTNGTETQPDHAGTLNDATGLK